MKPILTIITLWLFPSGLFLLTAGLLYQWFDRKLLALLQNRIGPCWFQPFADTFKLLSKEEIIPEGVASFLFIGLPVVALAGALTAPLYVPMAGLAPSYGFRAIRLSCFTWLSLLRFARVWLVRIPWIAFR